MRIQNLMALAGASLLVLALSACGGGGSSTSPPTGSSSSSSSSGGSSSGTSSSSSSSSGGTSSSSGGTSSSSGSSSSSSSGGTSSSSSSGGTSSSSSSSGGSSSGGGPTYYMPYTVFMGSNLQPTGLYLVNAANPSATPLQVTSSALDSPPATGNGYTVENGYATLYSWTYDAATQQATDLHPALEVYGSGGHLYQISLSDPASGPQQLSSGSYAALCVGPSAYQAGPYGGSAPQYVVVLVDLVSGDNCATPADQQDWVIAAGTASGTAPTVATFDGLPVAAFWDTTSGLLTGYLIMGPQSGGTANLYLYSPSFVQQSSVLSSIPESDFIYAMGEINGIALIDVETYQGTTQPYSATDQLDLVNSSGAVTQAASYSINNSSPYFNANCDGGQFISWIWGINAGSDFVFSYPDQTSGDLNIYTLSAAGGTPMIVYTGTSLCLDDFNTANAANLVMDLTDDTSNVNSADSIALSGPATQAPIVLTASNSTSGSTSGYVQYIIGNNAWITGTQSDDTYAVNIGSGAVVATYNMAIYIIGDVWTGYDAEGIVRSGVLLGENSGGYFACSNVDGSGFIVTNAQAVDTTTLTATSFAGGTTLNYCVGATNAYYFGTGSMVLGGLAATNGTATQPTQYDLASFSLGTTLQLFPDVATPPSGAYTGGLAFWNMLVSSNAYFGGY